MAGLNLGLAQGGTGAGLYDGLAQWLKQRQQTALVDQDLALGERKMRYEDEDRATEAQGRASGQQAMEAALRAIEESDLPPLQKLVSKVNLMQGKGLSVPEPKEPRRQFAPDGTLVDVDDPANVGRTFAKPTEAPRPQPQTIRTKDGIQVIDLQSSIGQTFEPEPDTPARQPSAQVIIGVPTVDEQGRPVTRYMTKGEAREGGVFSRPTAEMINQGMSRERVTPVLQAIAELSERINVQQGALAKIQGAAAQAQARLNLNDDVAEYESLVKGFTPVLARALSHTGVLTEEDVRSARQVLPHPTESKSLRDRKVARVQSLIRAISATGRSGAAGTTGAATPGQPADPLGIR